MLTILTGDVIEQLRTLPDESVHCCVTSPPYWGLRDYGTAQWEGGEVGCNHIGIESRTVSGGDGKQYTNEGSNRVFSGDCKCGAKRIDSQLGLEKTPEEYVAKMVEVFREVRRVLRKDGTLWRNLGDSYWNGGGEKRDGGHGFVDGGKPKLDAAKGSLLQLKSETKLGLKPKDLCGIPWRVAFALQADGWWLRSDIIWAKPNPMPESVTDRPTKAHEYLFLLTKASSYFYDAEAIREPHAEPWRGNGEHESSTPHSGRLDDPTGKQQAAFTVAKREYNPAGRNKRSVWTVATAPYPEAHFATYPPDLIKPCILAGTSAKGCCAKCGSPWERITENKPMVIDRSTRTHSMGQTRSSGTMLEPAESKTIGWQPTCKHYEKNMSGSGTSVPGHKGNFKADGSPFSTPKITTGWKETCDCEGATIPCTVLDPFAGSGTTGAVALELGRKAVLIELNPKYVELIERRCSVTMGLPLAV